MEVANWTSAGKIRADRIDVNSLFSNVNISGSIVTPELVVVSTGRFICKGFPVAWKGHTVMLADGSTQYIFYLGLT